jgi:hypothetical protein
LNAIQSIVVAVPNNAGQGYNVTVTPSVTQVVCIFIATNQNMTITTSGYLVRTLRSNGTVIQDVSNNNTTIPYLKIGTILYKLSIGNGDGVIALCPVDMNIIRVNENSISDLMYHNNEAQKVSLYYSSPTYSASVTFNFTSINLSNKRIFGRVWLDVGVDFDFANIIFNGAGDTTDSQTTEGTYSLTSKSDTDPWVNGSLPLTSYQNRSREFYSFAVSQNMKMLVEFNIYQIFDQTLVDNKKQLVCNGRYTAVAKTSGSAGNFRSSGRFGRISDQGLNLFSIGFSGYNLSATNSIRMAYLDMDVISVPTFTTI